MRLTIEERMELADIVGIAIRNARKVHNISQTSIAGVMGMSNSHISKLETCARLPSIETLFRLAKALDCRLHIEFRTNNNVVCNNTLDR